MVIIRYLQCEFCWKDSINWRQYECITNSQLLSHLWISSE